MSKTKNKKDKTKVCSISGKSEDIETTCECGCSCCNEAQCTVHELYVCVVTEKWKWEKAQKIMMS